MTYYIWERWKSERFLQIIQLLEKSGIIERYESIESLAREGESISSRH
ncbi:MAG: hypothetical protein IPJ74_13160 [Saprospiraceae bacterium]|nr:hypothetical protein [Saprospiraceae bacterium]